MKKLHPMNVKNQKDFDKKVCSKKAQADVNKVKKEAAIKRKLRSDAWWKLRPHGEQILAWAKAVGGSRFYVTQLVKLHLGIDVEPIQIYRYVIHMNGGEWTHPHKKQNKETSNG